jgi:F0F1-type ATP synthase membrane subunit c/vacuolar-type H+-ATPase subunit K
MEETVKKTSLFSKILIWFLVISTLVIIYLTVKLLVVSTNFRSG